MTDPMSPEELRACRERAEAATPGDLTVAREDEEHGAITYAVVRGGLTLAFVPEDTRGKWEHSSAKADAAFWASARADVLRLLATIAARDAQLEAVRSILAEAGCDCDRDHREDECDDECDHGDPCLGCRIEAAMKGASQ